MAAVFNRSIVQGLTASRSGSPVVSPLLTPVYNPVVVGPMPQIFPEAPNDNNQYVRVNRQWQILTGQGPQGPQGDSGPVGPVGPQGLMGGDGAAGPQGPQGMPGVTGDPGPIGPQGSTGPQGPRGMTGPAGPQTQGPTGPQGPVGPQGPPGNDGAQGPQGSIGPVGPSLNLKGTVDTSTSLPATGNFINDMYITADTGDGWVWDGTQWNNVGKIVGPQGPQGIQGPQGLQGPVGNDGVAGPQGIQGLEGLPGPDGAQGPQGLQGLTGVAGPMGMDGPMGPQGPQGQAGAQGAIGPQGPAGTGSQGPQGVAGPTGPQGIPGPTGPQGPTGLTGPQGTTGSQGPQGAVGPAGPSVVSKDSNNAATLGSDSLIFVPLAPVASAAVPLMDGTAAVGTTNVWARGDHVHPNDSSKFNVKGTVAADNATAGNVGEFISSSNTAGTALTSGTTVNIVTLSLTPGDYDVWGYITFTPANALTVVAAAVSPTSATLPTAAQMAAGTGSMAQYNLNFTNAKPATMQTGMCRVNISANTSIYLVAQATFTSTLTAAGAIFARRVR